MRPGSRVKLKLETREFKGGNNGGCAFSWPIGAAPAKPHRTTSRAGQSARILVAKQAVSKITGTHYLVVRLEGAFLLGPQVS